MINYPYIYRKQRDMVTIIKIDKVDGKEWVFEINEAFNSVHEFDIFDCILVRESDCGNYELILVYEYLPS